jgi:hypothetical protein
MKSVGEALAAAGLDPTTSVQIVGALTEAGYVVRPHRPTADMMSAGGAMLLSMSDPAGMAAQVYEAMVSGYNEDGGPQT